MRVSVIATGLFLLAPLAALAAEPPAYVQPQSVRQGEPVICHYFYHEGTVIKRQYCFTQREWDRYRIEQQADISEFQQRELTMHH